MEQEEIQKICIKKNILLDAALLNAFSSFQNVSLLEAFLDKVKVTLGKRFITLSLIKKNSDKVGKFASEFFPKEDPEREDLYSKLDLSDESIYIKEQQKRSRENLSSSQRKVKVLYSFYQSDKKPEVKDFVNHFRGRYESMKDLLQNCPELENLVSISKISGEKQKFSVIGIVSDKQVTKNKNLIFEIEDLTGKMKVLVSSGKEDLVKDADEITLDSVLGFQGTGNKEILFANKILFPEATLPERKRSDAEEYALFLGDIHYGSKNFLEKDFLKFIDYLNGKVQGTPEVKNIKYLFIAGDLVTGIGNYPDQEPDLKIIDLEAQFRGIADLLGQIRKDITIIISPGNHDGVRLAEPQPPLDEKYAWPVYELENAILVSNPSTVNIGKSNTFDGFNVLIYHGFSFPFYANVIPSLISEKAMNQPEKIMKYLLKNRHLAPTHTSAQYLPLESDPLVIKDTPDIFLSGHTHKSGVAYFNNILIVSASSWEGLTPYQEKFGNTPDHCKVPMINLKTRQIKILDFETGEDKVKLYHDENKSKEENGNT
jgi:DNA polymerase II small subunit